MKKWISVIMGIAFSIMATGCERDAQIASYNLSEQSDMFQIDRRVIFYNGITGEYILIITGRCSIEERHNQLEVTCKTGSDAYKKHFLGLSDNVTYFAEQLESHDVSVYNYKVVFKPQSILPDIDLKGSMKELGKLRN